MKPVTIVKVGRMIMSMHIPRGSLDEELDAVCTAMAEESKSVCLPKLFLKLGLETIRRVEKNHHLIIEPLVGIDLARMACMSSKANDTAIATLSDIIAELPAAISKNASAGSAGDITESVPLCMPNSGRFLQEEIPGCDFSNLIKKIHAACGPNAAMEPKNIKKTLQSDRSFEELEVLSRWVMENETIQNFRIHEITSQYLKAYQEGIDSEIQAKGRFHTRMEEKA